MGLGLMRTGGRLLVAASVHTDRNGKVLPPTQGKQAEVGVKYQPGVLNTLLTAALYDLRQTNKATQDPDVPVGFGSIAAGEVRSRGVEGARLSAHVRDCIRLHHLAGAAERARQTSPPPPQRMARLDPGCAHRASGCSPDVLRHAGELDLLGCRSTRAKRRPLARH